jgi:phenylpropionate dioxygenase-like ring-hydroxylating dioxygenase large terminal subunit
MAMLDHWHPVFPSHQLKAKPVASNSPAGWSACSAPPTGRPAAIDDVCPHRRLKLSYGRVVGDRVECKYHGWTFDPCGNGESPGAPKLHTCTESFDAREQNGYVWVKSRRSNPQFPDVAPEGFFHLGNFQHEVPAPLELTVDNFNEIEHSGTVHDTFGYDTDRMHEVRVRFEPTDTSVKVSNVGPTKTLNRLFSWGLGVRPGDLFHDEWTTHFSPVYSVYDHWWTSPDGKREGMIRWRLYMFFWPIDGDRTAVTSFVYAKSRYPGPAGGLRFLKYIFRREVDREVRQDISMLEHMADKSVGIEGLKLSRFDKVLGLTRERITRVYRGEHPLRIAIA